MVSSLQPVPNRNRQGIALVVVLGFLAILTIMAVSFTINMRTERLTSRLYLDSVRARNLVDVGLAQALSYIDSQMCPGGNCLSYPPFTNLYSGSNNDIELFVGTVTNYLPSRYPVGTVRPGFELFRFTNSVSLVTTGRVAFHVVNLTGLLDMNYVGHQPSRRYGRDPGEIQINHTVLTDFPAADSWSKFLYMKTNVLRRVDTLFEFNELMIYSNLVGSSRFSRFLPFSWSPVERNPLGGPKTVISQGADTILTNNVLVTNIIAGLLLSGIPTNQVYHVFTNFLDYIDTDNDPRSLDSFTTEAVPMINEIVFSNRLTKLPNEANPTNFIYQYDAYVSVETMYLFPFNSLFYEIRPNPPPFTFSPVVPAGLTPTPSDLVGVTSTNQHRPFTYNVTTYHYRKQAVGDQLQFPPGLAANPGSMAARLNITAPLTVQTNSPGTNIYDRVPFPFPSTLLDPAAFNLRLNGVFGLPVGQSLTTNPVAIAVDDPRFNHRVFSGAPFSTNTSGWRESNPHSLGTNNQLAAINEGLSEMYVRNRALETPDAVRGVGSVAELGYLSIGEPWKTIAIATNSGRIVNRVLDFFTVMPSDSNMPGRVHMNSRFSNALQSVFIDMPVTATPVTPGISSISIAKALDPITKSLSSNNFDRLSKIGDDANLFSVNLNPDLTTDARKESVIRNSIDLLTVRQNYFGIIIEAQVLGGDGGITARERALAIVWRDPVNIGGVNETVVRYFTWLTEDQ